MIALLGCHTGAPPEDSYSESKTAYSKATATMRRYASAEHMTPTSRVRSAEYRKWLCTSKEIPGCMTPYVEVNRCSRGCKAISLIER